MSVLDLTQAARLFYGADEVAELHRDGQRLWPFGPDLLGWDGITGASYYADPATLYSDAGVTLAGVGEAVRQINDLAGTGINGGQATLSARPKFGRGPRQIRNLLRATEDLTDAVWVKERCSVVALGGGAFKLREAVGNPANGFYGHCLRFNASPIPNVNSRILTIEARAAERSRLSIHGRSATAWGWTTVDLLTGATVAGASGGNISVTILSTTPLADGWWRIVAEVRMIWDAATGSFTLSTNLVGAGNVGINYSGDGVSGVEVRFPQLEMAMSTNYQSVDATGLLVTEAGVDSDFGFLRFDADDVIQSTIPAGLTGQVLVAGRSGSWVNDVAIAPGGSMFIGTDLGYFQNTTQSWTGGLRRGLTAIGDVIGWTVRAGGFSADELNRLLRDYGRKGAAGLLTATGPNLAPNPNFDTDSGWTKSGAGVSWSNGQYTISDVAGVDHYISGQLSGLVADRVYIGEVNITAQTATAAGFRVRMGASAGAAADFEHLHPPAPFTGIWRFAFVARRPNPWMTFLASNTGQFVTINSVSVRELVAGPLP